MRSIALLFLFVFVLGSAVQAQEANVWKKLSKISYKKEYDEILGFKVDIPVFSEEVKSLEGQEIVVKGYIIPVEGYKNHTEFIFSAFPYNMCFFCGGAGPETVMEVEAVEEVAFTAEQIEIRGILRLNNEDINKLMYRLEEVKPVK